MAHLLSTPAPSRLVAVEHKRVEFTGVSCARRRSTIAMLAGKGGGGSATSQSSHYSPNRLIVDPRLWSTPLINRGCACRDDWVLFRNQPNKRSPDRIAEGKDRNGPEQQDRDQRIYVVGRQMEDPASIFGDRVQYRQTGHRRTCDKRRQFVVIRLVQASAVDAANCFSKRPEISESEKRCA